MNREWALAAAALSIVAVAAIAALVVPGALADPAAGDDESIERPGHVSVAEVTIAAGEVTGGSATLSVDTYLDHDGGPVENVTVVHRATDTNTGLVEDSRELDVGDLDDGSEHLVSGSVTVPRESDYRIETIVYENGTRVESTSREVAGVDTLAPDYADTGVEFHRFDRGDGYGPDGADLPAVAYTVESTTNETATLDVSTYLTNAGDDPEDGLRLEITARQSGSNVVADSGSVDVGEISPGATATPAVEIEVPAEYDYYLDAVLWKEGTIVGTARAPANLGPGELTVEDGGREDGIEVSDFEREEERGTDDEYDDGDAGEDVDGQPGFGLAIAVAAALVVAIALARRNADD